jgi:hypothetical protein
MSWRVIGTGDVGDGTHYGGFDMAKISRLFTAVANVDTVDFDSNVFFRDTRLKLKNGANSVTVRTNSITANTDLIIPNPVGSTSATLLTDNNTAVLTNKTINAWDNSMSGFDTFPSVKKTGMIPCGAVTGGGVGTGLLNGFIDQPTVPVRGQDATFGAYWRYATGTVANIPTGIRLPARWILKEWLPYFRCKTRVATTTSNTRQYCGLSFETTVPASDTPIDTNESAVLVGWRSTDTNWQVFLNSGTTTSSSTPSVINTNIAKSTAVRQVEIVFTTSSNVRVRIMDGNAASVLYLNNFTTNLPADPMSPSMTMSDTTTTSNNYDAFFMELSQNV